MNKLMPIFVFLLVLPFSANANPSDFQMERLWSVQFDTIATSLGDVFLDADGENYFPVCTQRSVEIVSSGQTIWSLDVANPVSAGIYDFGTEDGLEAFVTSISGQYGVIFHYYGEDFQNVDHVSVLPEEEIRQMYPTYRISHGYLPVQGRLTSGTPDSLKTIILGNVDRSVDNGWVDDSTTDLYGRLFTYSPVEQRLRAIFNGGKSLKALFIQGQDEIVMLYAHDDYHHYYMMERYGNDIYDGSSVQRITRFNSNLQHTGDITLTDYSWENRDEYNARLIFQDMAVSTADGGRLFVIMRGSQSNQLLEYYLPNFRLLSTTELPRCYLKSLQTYGDEYLLIFDRDDNMIVFDRETMDIAVTIPNIAEGVVSVRVGDYNNDDELELAILSANELSLNHIVTLDVPDAHPNSGAPYTLFLSEPHPNPFNPSTTLTYTLPVAEQVKLSVYDLAGRKVATLFDGYQSAGEHNISWNAENQPTGFYIARLSSTLGNRDVKMLLMK